MDLPVDFHAAMIPMDRMEKALAYLDSLQAAVDAAPDDLQASLRLAEAQAAASLEHPNIVQVFTTGETDDGALYLAIGTFTSGLMRDQISAVILGIMACFLVFIVGVAGVAGAICLTAEVNAIQFRNDKLVALDK